MPLIRAKGSAAAAARRRWWSAATAAADVHDGGHGSPVNWLPKLAPNWPKLAKLVKFRYAGSIQGAWSSEKGPNGDGWPASNVSNTGDAERINPQTREKGKEKEKQKINIHFRHTSYRAIYVPSVLLCSTRELGHQVKETQNQLPNVCY